MSPYCCFVTKGICFEREAGWFCKSRICGISYRYKTAKTDMWASNVARDSSAFCNSTPSVAHGF